MLTIVVVTPVPLPVASSPTNLLYEYHLLAGLTGFVFIGPISAFGWLPSRHKYHPAPMQSDIRILYYFVGVVDYDFARLILSVMDRQLTHCILSPPFLRRNKLRPTLCAKGIGERGRIRRVGQVKGCSICVSCGIALPPASERRQVVSISDPRPLSRLRIASCHALHHRQGF